MKFSASCRFFFFSDARNHNCIACSQSAVHPLLHRRRRSQWRAEMERSLGHWRELRRPIRREGTASVQRRSRPSHVEPWPPSQYARTLTAESLSGSWATCYPRRSLRRHTSISRQMNYWRRTTPAMFLTWAGISRLLHSKETIRMEAEAVSGLVIFLFVNSTLGTLPWHHSPALQAVIKMVFPPHSRGLSEPHLNSLVRTFAILENLVKLLQYKFKKYQFLWCMEQKKKPASVVVFTAPTMPPIRSQIFFLRLL